MHNHNPGRSGPPFIWLCFPRFLSYRWTLFWIDAQNLENILTPVKAAEYANILEKGTDKDQDENNSQTSNKQDDNPTRTAKPSPWKRKLSVSSENSDQHARTLTPSKSRGILITNVTNDLCYIKRGGCNILTSLSN